MYQLKIETLTKKAFAPFGEIITPPSEGGFPTNDGTAIRFDEITKLDVTELKGFPLLSLFRVAPISFPFNITKLERHPHSSQAFIPLISRPFLSIVAPASDKINPAEIKGFYVPSGQGINYRRGTWHHQVIALKEETLFLSKSIELVFSNIVLKNSLLL